MKVLIDYNISFFEQNRTLFAIEIFNDTPEDAFLIYNS